MKKSRFREEQMVTILREADRRPVPEVAKQHGVSAQTIYSWRKHFGTLEPADVKRLRQLEQENGRLKKMVADRDLEIDVLKEITRKKWRAHVCAGSRSRMRADAGCRAAGRAPGAPDECPTDLSSVASGGPARAAPAPASAGSLPPRPTAGPDRDESRVGLRLRLRYVRGWPVAEVPDRRRRVHA